MRRRRRGRVVKCRWREGGIDTMIDMSRGAQCMFWARPYASFVLPTCLVLWTCATCYTVMMRDTYHGVNARLTYKGPPWSMAPGRYHIPFTSGDGPNPEVKEQDSPDAGAGARAGSGAGDPGAPRRHAESAPRSRARAGMSRGVSGEFAQAPFDGMSGWAPVCAAARRGYLPFGL